MPQRGTLSIHPFRRRLFTSICMRLLFLPLVLLDLFNRKAMCLGSHFVFGFLGGASAVHFDATYALLVPPEY